LVLKIALGQKPCAGVRSQGYFFIMDNTMNKRPSTQFYPGDWWRAVDLRKCCMATQGCWFNMLLVMWDEKEQGKITGTKAEICRVVGCDLMELQGFLDDAKLHHFANVTICNNKVTIVNRRMHEGFIERESTKRRVAAHREKKGRVRNANVTPLSSTSSSSSTSKGKEIYKEKAKKKHLEFVFLTNDEYEKLVVKFGKPGADDRIANLNNGIGSKGYKYKSHYYTILSWERKNEKERAAKKAGRDHSHKRVAGVAAFKNE